LLVGAVRLAGALFAGAFLAGAFVGDFLAGDFFVGPEPAGERFAAFFPVAALAPSAAEKTGTGGASRLAMTSG
jgi:hypothetical protein